MDHFVPVFITKLGDIHPERGQNIERVARRHRTLRQRAAQIDGLGLAVAPAQQFGFEQIEIVELLALTERCMIGDIVGGSDEIVERQDQRPVTRMNDPGRDRKILVAVCLAGSQFARGGHQELATLVWAREVLHPLSSTHADRPQIPYRGIRYQNQCFLRLAANADCGQIERITGRSGDYWMRVRPIARGFSAPDRRPWSIWDDVAEGRPE